MTVIVIVTVISGNNKIITVIMVVNNNIGNANDNYWSNIDRNKMSLLLCCLIMITLRIMRMRMVIIENSSNTNDVNNHESNYSFVDVITSVIKAVTTLS